MRTVVPRIAGECNSGVSGDWKTLNLQRPPFFFLGRFELSTSIARRGTDCGGVWNLNELIAGFPSRRESPAVRPRVSIIIPTYNRAIFLGVAIASALGRDFQSLEVIVIDDGSTDETKEILGTFGDQHLRCVHQARGGPSRARNRAI